MEEENKTEIPEGIIQEPNLENEIRREVQKKPEVNIPKKKSSRNMIVITILLTALVLVGGYFAFQYELDRNEIHYNQGYTNGLLYTQDSGNIVFIENGNFTETPITEICNMLLQQQLNQQGGQ